MHEDMIEIRIDNMKSLVQVDVNLNPDSRTAEIGNFSRWLFSISTSIQSRKIDSFGSRYPPGLHDKYVTLRGFGSFSI
jgi:hypothetical protein